MLYRPYAGIGSRQTPKLICNRMTALATALELCGFTLRSGGAEGADQAFEAGVQNPANKEIYLPWRGFEGNPSPLYNPSPAAMQLAAKYHPAWERCTAGMRKLHARNCHQMLGKNLDLPVEFVLCWTSGGQMKGGTAQALRIAVDYKIPIYNLGSPSCPDSETILKLVVGDIRA